MNESVSYYQEFGHLMWEISGHSRFFNLGYCEGGQKKISPGKAQRQLIRKVAEAGNFQKGMRILDVGCGLGGPAFYVAEKIDCKVIGIDTGTFQMEHAKKPGHSTSMNGVHLHYGDAMNLPFKNHTFDRIYCVESAFHYPDKVKFLKEAAKILKKEGVLVVADILRSSNKKETYLSKKLGQALSAASFFDVDLYQKAASQAGLECINPINISKNVSMAFPLWTRSLNKKFIDLLKLYRFQTLFKIGLALMLAPLMGKIGHFNYHILVFKNIHIHGV